LLADDPGAGKTIMAGLYIKELMLRGDLARCLVVAPGGLVEQWQSELHDKFGLRFSILTRDLFTATLPGENPFRENPYLIARMDQLSRSDELIAHLDQAHFDLVVVDEAHRMAAHYFGGELKKTRRYELGELLGKVSEHLLLMTATPHAGKEEDFQLLLALLDGDRDDVRGERVSTLADLFSGRCAVSRQAGRSLDSRRTTDGEPMHIYRYHVKVLDLVQIARNRRRDHWVTRRRPATGSNTVGDIA
jgi:superfamily II DNA or RNA helicase